MTSQNATNQPQISIIVPVYKVERHLRECLDSILGQTFTDWECLLVDDGSPDTSPQICDEYAARDPRFRVIHRANGGLSAARNSGLREARGACIGFVDSDDWLAPQFFERLCQLITDYDADMAQVGFRKEYAGYTRAKRLVRQITQLDRRAIARELVYDRRIPSYSWNKLFRREVINAEYPEGKVFEDMAVLNHWARDIRSAVLAPDMLYHYRMRKGSILHTDYSRWIHYFDAYCERVREMTQLEPEALTEQERARFLWKAALDTAKILARKVSDRASLMEHLRSVIAAAQTFPAPTLRELGLKRSFRAWLLMHHPAAFVRLMRVVATTQLDAKWRESHLYD